MNRALLLLISLVIAPTAAAAERGLVARGPLEVQAGAHLAVELETPHGLTPPPGIQNDRALRGFAARLCTADRCTALEPLNVRPRDGWSLIYRAEFAVPSELVGRYDLDVRFPGGSDSLRDGVLVRAAAAPPAAKRAPHEAPSRVPLYAGIGVGLLLLALSAKLAATRRRE